MYNGHLSIEEIEQLSQQKGPAGNQTHVETCPQCKSLLEKCQAISAKLQKLASVRIGAGNPMNCPDQRVWFDVAAGTLPESESLKHVQHAADCQACGKKLAIATRMFAEELTPEEENALAALPSSAATIQNKLAERLADAATAKPAADQAVSEKPKRSFWKPLSFSLAGAGVAVTAFFLAYAMYVQHEIRVAEELISGAYKKGRPMEYRVAGVPYGPVRQERGTSSVLPSIEVAEIDKFPLLASQAALLERDSASAITILEKARRTRNDSLAIRDNLAVAYAMEAESTGLTTNYDRAIQLCKENIGGKVPDPTAYFNLALIFQRRGHPEDAADAAEALRQFLRLEWDPDWRAEAEKKLP